MGYGTDPYGGFAYGGAAASPPLAPPLPGETVEAFARLRVDEVTARIEVDLVSAVLRGTQGCL